MKLVSGFGSRSTFFAMLIGAWLVSGFGSQAQAASFSFTGSFQNDNDVQLFNFSVGATSLVTLLTYSYAGGTNAAGTVIQRGGFDPILALFDASSGLEINQNDDGGANVPADAVTGSHFDTFLQSTLDPGNYIVSVMQYDNFANGPALANGFLRSGPGNVAFTSIFGCSNQLFCDVNADNRTNQWAFDILNVASANEVSAVPLPAALPLFASGLGVMGWFARRRKRMAAA
jgi:hypothetical protein